MADLRGGKMGLAKGAELVPCLHGGPGVPLARK